MTAANQKWLDFVDQKPELKKVWTADEVKEKLRSNYDWLVRGVLAIYKFQTLEEKAKGDTVQHNGVGFSGPDGSYLSYIARWLLSGNDLTGSHLEKCRQKMLKYAGQLAKIANGAIK